MSSKPGRNDPCPCGSGKKYKACHAAEDRAREAPAPSQPHPLTADLQAAMALLGDPDVAKLAQTLDRLGALLTQWGPAPNLRFEADAFEAHLTRALEALPANAGEDPVHTHHELLVSTVRQFGTRPFLDGFRAAMLQRATAPGVTPEDRQVLCVAALLSSPSTKKGAFQAEDIPVLDIVFHVQFREWSAHHRELASKFEALTRLAEEELSPEAREALQKAREGDPEALLQHVQSDPRLVERISQEAKERSARVEAKLREPSTPPLFAPEEELWFTCVLWEPLRAVKATAGTPTTRRAAVENLIRAVKGALDAELLEGMLERLRQKSKDASLDEALRAWYTDAAIAVEAEPSRMVMAALFTASQEAVGRSAEEMVLLADIKARPVWTAEDFAPYPKLLEDMGLPVAAARVRRCQEWLREHPVALAAEGA